MCGIAGIIDRNNVVQSPNYLKKFSDYNKFRGPDAYGEHKDYIDEDHTIGLTHHRLSIVDLNSEANQPMLGNSWVLTFNGEIYNFKELRAELEDQNISLKTNSDTEVILQLLETHSPKVTFAKLDGMFAIAAYNKNDKTLFLARDRWGKKPLYYHSNEHHFSYSSDIRSFSKLEQQFSINTSGLKFYFTELSLPQPQTVFNEISQVKPGNAIKIKDGEIEEFEFIDLFEKQTIPSLDGKSKNVVQTTKQLLLSAVEKRQYADVDVGAFLSGGIDSGLIVSMASRNNPSLNTYTVGFNDKSLDERPFAKLVSKKYNTNHTELLVDSNDIDLEELVMEFGEPFADSSMIPSYIISKEVTKHQKVVLSGDGGDELFCGNATYLQAYKFDEIRRKTKAVASFKNILSALPVEKIKALGEIQKSPLYFSGRELYRSMGFSQVELEKLFTDKNEFQVQKVFEEVIENASKNTNNIFEGIFNGSIRTRLLNDYLVKIDRASMFASLEIRSPFLDDNLFNYIKELDKKELMPNKILKGILKELAVEFLPSEILNKPKSGFAIPLDNWFRGKWKEKFVHYVFDKKQNLVELNYNYIESVWEDHNKGQNYGHKLYAILVFHIWVDQFNKE